MNSSLKYSLLAFYAVFFAYLSIQPGGSLDESGLLDKLLHFIAYGAFALLAFWMPAKTRVLVVYCVAILSYSVFLELLQSVIPGREMLAIDLVANTLGVIFGGAAGYFLYVRK